MLNSGIGGCELPTDGAAFETLSAAGEVSRSLVNRNEAVSEKTWMM
jgi:hypothetical protein